MGCNCKKNVNPKYMDNDELNQLSGHAPNIFENLGNLFVRMLIGLIIGIILIISLIPVTLYLVCCIWFGKQPTARISNYTKWLKKG